MEDKKYTWPQGQPQEKIQVIAETKDLKGRFSNAFSIQFNGSNFSIDFCSESVREDKVKQRVLVSKIFLDQQGFQILANLMMKSAKQIQEMLKDIPQLPKESSK